MWDNSLDATEVYTTVLDAMDHSEAGPGRAAGGGVGGELAPEEVVGRRCARGSLFLTENQSERMTQK